MDLSRLRLRLTLGYLGIFASILILLGAIAVFGFSLELTRQEDELLTQEARNQAANLLGFEQREVLSDGSRSFSWVALDPDGTITDRDPSADSLGLPAPELARESLAEDDVVASTIQGEVGNVRVVSMPMYRSGELVGTIQYARSLASVRRAVNSLLLVLVPLGIGALGLAAIGGQFMALRAVGPIQKSFDRQRTFVADASHELKTPLTLMRANAEVLQRGLTVPEDREFADDALAEIDKMDETLSDLLLVAQLDANQLTVKKDPFEVAEAVSQVAERFAAHADSAKLSLERYIPEGLKAMGDRHRTEQILAILVDNAIQHTPPHGRITIVGQTSGSSTEILVEDTGPGIPKEHLPRLFERFYRVDKARSREHGGSGLGLAIARDLASAQGGELEAENSSEKGALLRLILQAG